MDILFFDPFSHTAWFPSENGIDISGATMTQTNVQTFKALSDATRLRILLLLMGNGELCVCDIMESLEIPQSTTSRHLSILRNAGYVEGERRGAWMYYQTVTCNNFQVALLNVIHQHRATFPEAQQDAIRLQEHLKVKETSACEELPRD